MSPLKKSGFESDALSLDAPTAAREGPARRSANPQASQEGHNSAQLDPLHESLAYAIRRAQVRCDEALGRHLKVGMSPAKLAALTTVGANSGVSQAELGGLLNIASPSVVKVVDELERLDLVRRELSISDRRVHALKVTDKGALEIQRYQLVIKSFERSIASALDARERAQLLSMLASIAPTA